MQVKSIKLLGYIQLDDWDEVGDEAGEGEG